MFSSLHDYTTTELRALLRQIKAAIRLAEEAETLASPGAAPPPAAEPPAAEPSVAKPLATELAATERPTAELSAVEPSMAEAPAAELPAAESSVTEQPAAEQPRRRRVLRGVAAATEVRSPATAEAEPPAAVTIVEPVVPPASVQEGATLASAVRARKGRRQAAPAAAPEPVQAPPPAPEAPAAAIAALAVEPVSAESVTATKSATEAIPAPIKYMHPSNRNLTWNGVGEQPEWMAVYFARGGSWTALENTAARLAPRKR
jgi:hypothetical protein